MKHIKTLNKANIKDKEKYNNIINNLKSTDYSQEFEKYKEQWKNLLEG